MARKKNGGESTALHSIQGEEGGLILEPESSKKKWKEF